MSIRRLPAMIATLECSDHSAPGLSMRLSPFESLPTELVAAVCDHLDRSNRRELRAVSKGMQYHLDYILRDNFTHIQCRLLPVEETAMRRFRESSLAQEVRCLTWVFAAFEDLFIRTSSKTYMAANDGPERITVRRYEPPTHRKFTRAEYSGLVLCAIASLPNLREIRFVFNEALPRISLNTSGQRFGIWIDELDRAFDYVCLVADNLEGDRSITISAHGPGRLIPPSATLHSKHKIAYVEYNGFGCHNGSPMFPHHVTLRFGQQTGYRLKFLALDHLSVDLQDIELLSKQIGPLEHLWLRNCSILKHRYSDFDLSHSQSLTMLRELVIRDCSGFAADLPKMFKQLIQYGRLEILQFEDVEGLYFDWDNDGSYDNGSKIPALIEELGIGGTLAKMDKCWEYIAPDWW